MEKSIYSRDYKIFLSLLRETREKVGVTQEQLAERLKETQSTISKCERGERRIDAIELRRICDALGIPMKDFVELLEARLK